MHSTEEGLLQTSSSYAHAKYSSMMCWEAVQVLMADSNALSEHLRV